MTAEEEPTSKKPKSNVLTVRFPGADGSLTLRALDAYAAVMGTSRNAVIRQASMEYIDLMVGTPEYEAQVEAFRQRYLGHVAALEEWREAHPATGGEAED